MKVLVQSIGVREEKVRTQHEIELMIGEGKDRQRRRYIPLAVCFDIATKEFGCILPNFPVTFDVAVEVPRVPVHARCSMGAPSVWLSQDQFLQGWHGHRVDGVCGSHLSTEITGFGGKAGRSARTVQDPSTKVLSREAEHRLVLTKGA
jgi:hypothetical protein